MGRQYIRGGYIHVRQQKTGAELDIPIVPELDAIIATAPGNMTFLVTEFGKPFTAAGFGNWFRERCNEAGLRHCLAHGLRKAASRRLAEFGCTVHEVAAITCHASLREGSAIYEGRRPEAARYVGSGKDQEGNIEWLTGRKVSQLGEIFMQYQRSNSVVAPRAGFEPATNRLTAGSS